MAKLKLGNQIAELKRKGIKFEIINVNEAKDILSNKNYYYKLTCYKRNFYRDPNTNKYVDLQFAYLYDLSILDALLREVLGKMCLDVEHVIKSKLLKEITNSNEDGYTISTDFDNYMLNIHNQRNLKNRTNYVYKNIFKKVIGSFKDPMDYDYKIYSKYQNQNPVPIWVLLEKMSFGQLISFVEFYCSQSKLNFGYFKTAEKFLKMTKRIRDASFHNRPIFMNIADINQSVNLTTNSQNLITVSAEFKQLIGKYRILKGLTSEELRTYNDLFKFPKVHDIICLILIYKEYIVNTKMTYNNKRSTKRLYNRMNLHLDYYKNTPDMYNILKLLTIFFKSL